MISNYQKTVSSSVTELDLKSLSSVTGGGAITTIFTVGKILHTVWSLSNPSRAKAPGSPVWQGGRRSFAWAAPCPGGSNPCIFYFPSFSPQSFRQGIQWTRESRKNHPQAMNLQIKISTVLQEALGFPASSHPGKDLIKWIGRLPTARR